MSNYIKREDAERFIERHCYPIVHDINSHEQGMTITGIKQALDEIPSADVEPVKRGKWLRMSECSENIDDRYKCSKCGYVVHQKDRIFLMTYNRWCGHCGSRNDEVENG